MLLFVSVNKLLEKTNIHGRNQKLNWKREVRDLLQLPFWLIFASQKNGPIGSLVFKEINDLCKIAEKMIVLKYSETVARRCSVKKDVLRNFAKFTEKHLY